MKWLGFYPTRNWDSNDLGVSFWDSESGGMHTKSGLIFVRKTMNNYWIFRGFTMFYPPSSGKLRTFQWKTWKNNPFKTKIDRTYFVCPRGYSPLNDHPSFYTSHEVETLAWFFRTPVQDSPELSSPVNIHPVRPAGLWYQPRSVRSLRRSSAFFRVEMDLPQELRYTPQKKVHGDR